MKNIFILIWVTLIVHALGAQDVGVTGSFSPDCIDVGQTSTLTLTFSNNSSTQNIVAGGAFIVIDFPPAITYSTPDPPYIPTGTGASNFTWSRVGNLWRGTSNTTLNLNSQHIIEFQVSGIAAGMDFSLIMVDLSDINEGDGDTDPNNNNLDLPLKVLGPAPVELTSFNGKLLDCDQVNLNWNVAQELNNKGFEVERSFDGIKFKTIGTIEGAGNSTIETKYSFVDYNLRAADFKQVYYRLKQLDFDGKEDYPGSILSIKNDCISKFDFTLSPNPARDKTYISFSGHTLDKDASISLYDANGKFISKLVSDMENNTEINVSGISPGVYTVVVKSENYKETKRLIVTD